MSNFIISDNLNVSLTSYLGSMTSNTISGLTFYGNINSNYITTGNSLVNNTEFTRLSGLTGYVQTQINSKLPKNSPVVTYSLTNSLSNDRVLSAGTNIEIVNQNNLILKIGALEIGTILVETTGDENYALNNFNPNGFNGTYPNNSTNIIVNSLNVIKISGISGGTVGRNIFLKNGGNYLIILENEGTGSTGSNRFSLNDDSSLFLNPKDSVSLVYNESTQRWVQYPYTNGLTFSYYSDFYDSGFNFQRYFTSNYYLTWPANVCGFLVFSGGGGSTVPLTQMPTFSTYSACSKGCISLFRTSGSGVDNRVSSIGIGLQRFNNSYESNSGTSLCLISKFNVLSQSSQYIGSNDNWAVTFGTDNSNLSRAYSAMTSNKTTVPNLSGGSFWLFDYYTNPNYGTYFVQSTNNSYLSGTSSFPLSSLSSSTMTTFGVYSLSQSGDSYGSSTFFWMTPNGNSENFKIEPPIIKTGGTINGYPGINFYGAYNYSGNSNIEESSKLIIDKLGVNYIRRI